VATGVAGCGYPHSADFQHSFATAASPNRFDFDDDACDMALEEMDAVLKLSRRAKPPDNPTRKKRKRSSRQAEPMASSWLYDELAYEV